MNTNTAVQEQQVSNYFNSITALKAANAQSGHYFFSRSTIKFFKSKVEGGIIYGKYFITSEQPPHGSRIFTVREIKSIDGDINNNPLNAHFYSRKDAKDALKTFLDFGIMPISKTNF